MKKKALEAVDKIGFPIMVKASAGGGGKGMTGKKKGRIWEAVTTARSEALSSFGDDSVYLEKYIESPHHIEFQVLGDKYGNVIHLCERNVLYNDATKNLWKKHLLRYDEKLRKEMGRIAVEAAKSVKY